MVDLYGARPGAALELPLPDGRRVARAGRGVWRDYARQSGAVMLDARDSSASPATAASTIWRCGCARRRADRVQDGVRELRGRCRGAGRGGRTG